LIIGKAIDVGDYLLVIDVFLREHASKFVPL